MKRPHFESIILSLFLLPDDSLAAHQRFLLRSTARATFVHPCRRWSPLSPPRPFGCGPFSSSLFYEDKSRMSKDGEDIQESRKGPFPPMPSQIFLSLAQSQFELLAHSLFYPSRIYKDSSQLRENEKRPKIKSIALYLPQENSSTGQLEFLPAIVYPFTTNERIFIASDAESGIAPSIPPMLSKLPGFTHAKNLIPTYPFVTTRFSADTPSDPSMSSSSSSSVAIGSIEEIMYESVSSTNIRVGNAALSLPLYQGDMTLGILLVWPAPPPPFYLPVAHEYSWTDEDKRQISRAGRSLALALSLDNDRAMYRSQHEQFRVAVSDTLHQIKNPLQAVRTFAKLLQRQIATSRMKDDIISHGENIMPDYGLNIIPTGNTTSWTFSSSTFNSFQRNMDLMNIAENMVIQSVRAADLLLPMNDMIHAMENTPSLPTPFSLPPRVEQKQDLALVPLIPVQENQNLKKESASPRKNNQNESDTTTSSWMARRSKLQMKMTFITDILEPIMQSEKVLASDRGIYLEVDGMEIEELPGVLVCPQALQEAIINVLDNAMKYVKMGYRGQADVTNPSPHIRVRVRPNDPSISVGVTILVEDNGPGVSLSERQSIFSRGYRSKRTNDSSGSGIGLDISRSIIELMGGSLDIVNETQMDYLEGAVFCIILFRNPRIKNNKDLQTPAG